MCGDVELSPRAIELRIYLLTDAATYSFTCPNCRVLVTKAADLHIIDLLGSVGIRPKMVPPPRPHPGPPLTDVDLRKFIAALDRQDYLADVA
jgi:hypothetical protein